MGNHPHLPLRCASSTRGPAAGAPSVQFVPAPLLPVSFKTHIRSAPGHPSPASLSTRPRLIQRSKALPTWASTAALSSLDPPPHQPLHLRTQCGHRRVKPSKWLRRTGDFRLLTEDSAQWGTWTRLGGPWGLRTFPNPQLYLSQQTNFKAPLLAY